MAYLENISVNTGDAGKIHCSNTAMLIFINIKNLAINVSEFYCDYLQCETNSFAIFAFH